MGFPTSIFSPTTKNTGDTIQAAHINDSECGAPEFFAGGANTIRGYRERRVGPRDSGNHEPIGGEAYWVANLEETFPIYPDLIKGAVFFDMGNVEQEVSDFASGEVFSGVGLGVRVKTPIGPVKLDAGYPLDDIEGEGKKLRFYFSISQGF